jgi:general secretion pathway protein N
MTRSRDWFVRALLAGLCLALPAAAAAPPGLTDDESGLERAPLDVTSHVMPSPEAAGKPAAAAPTAPAPIVSANPLWVVPLSTLSATRERPLFSPSRRPPAPVAAIVPVAPVRAAPPPAAPPPEHPNLTLVGTVAGESEAVAVFIDQASRATVRLRAGEGHMGWVLQSVERRSARLQKDDLTETLELPRPAVLQGLPSAPVVSTLPAPPAPPPPAGGQPSQQREGCMPEPIGC